MPRVNALLDRFPQLDAIVLYIEEAHPADGWQVGGSNPTIAGHRTMEERIKAAEELRVVAPPTYPIYVDCMDDRANLAYGGFYERLYIILDGTIVYQGGAGPDGYHVAEVEGWAEAHFAK